MSFIDSVVNVAISATSATPTVQNFGTPALLGYHTHNADLIRTYTDTDGMLSDGFDADEPLFQLASSICKQNPRPPSFKVIRGTTSVQQTFTFKVVNSADGDVSGLSIQSPTTGVVTEMYHTAASQTAIQVATALALLVPTGVTASSGGTDTVTFTVTTSGNIWFPSAIKGGTYTDTSTSASPGTDLTAAALIDNDWYCVSHTWIDATNIDAVADWVDTNGKKIHAYVTADTNNVNAQTGIFKSLKDQSYERSYGQLVGYPGSAAGYGAAGLAAYELTQDPGSATWAFKGISGQTVDTLNPTQITNIRAQNGNFYVLADGVNRTFDGTAASGLHMDITQGIDALSSDIQLRVVTLLYNSPKVPYTRKGIQAVASEVSSALQAAVGTGFISNDIGFQFSVSVPDLADVSTSDKRNRVLRNVRFTAYAQGAIQTVLVQGVVNT